MLHDYKNVRRHVCLGTCTCSDLQVGNVVLAAGGCGIADIAGVGVAAAHGACISRLCGEGVLGTHVAVGWWGVGVRREASKVTCIAQFGSMFIGAHSHKQTSVLMHKH